MNEKLNINRWWDSRLELLNEYNNHTTTYQEILTQIINLLEKLVQSTGINGLVKGRVKQFEEFYRKLLIRSQTESIQDPFIYITDLIGLRIVAPFIEDMQTIENQIQKELEVIEVDYKSRTLSLSEFGYDSIHMLIKIPSSILKGCGYQKDIIAEIQLRTILQDAWAEVEHELVYKASIDRIDNSIRRKLIALNATLSLADTIFQEIREYQRKRYLNLKNRHQKLMDKVSTIPEKMEKSSETIQKLNNYPHEQDFPIDDLDLTALYAESKHKVKEDGSKSSLNDLLIEALHAHLESDLDKAVGLYTHLIAVNPNHYVYNHRGLAFFALSQYEKAIEDFTKAIDMAPDDMRVYTNRGLAYRMVKCYNEALEDFNKSLQLNPLWADTFYGRALTYYDIGNIKAAIEDCDHAIAINSDFKQVIRFKQFLQDQDI